MPHPEAVCGIAGIFGLAEAGPRLDRMLDAMAHRGPDGRGRLDFEAGALGMVRLALVDLSPRGQQPLYSPDGEVAILFNGEAYNFREERARLDYPFRSTTDAEVALALYLRHGEGFLERLRGMYALAILDRRAGARRLLLARDPFGIKPLYVAEGPEALVFASELRAMVASGLVPFALDPAGLADYLAHGFVVQPGTMLRGVRNLAPGSFEVHTLGGERRARRFFEHPAPRPVEEPLATAAARVRAALEESVRLHALADAPVGAFLSGGIDSTGIVSLMRPHVPDLRTYTLRFPDLPGRDEASEAEPVARALECRHTVVELTAAEVAREVPRFADALDQPSADGLNTYLISRAAARDVKGVLSGLGGDEWFAGYPVSVRMARWNRGLRGRAEALAGPLAARLADRLARLEPRLAGLAAREDPLALWLRGHASFGYREARRLAGLPAILDPGRFQRRRFERLLDELRPHWRAESAVGLSNLLDARVYMGSQLLRDADAASMAHSLELRVPLVDVEVARVARSVADRHKLAPTDPRRTRYADSGAKRVLIEALADKLPSGIAERPKRGFALPTVHWMRGALAPLVAETTSPEVLRARGLVDPAGIAGEGADLYPRRWSLMILELWCRAMEAR